MVFEGIGKSLERRLESIELVRSTTRKPTRVAQGFVEEVLGRATAQRCAVRYMDATLTVTAPSKKDANALLLRAGELAAVIRAEKVPLKRIVIS